MKLTLAKAQKMMDSFGGSLDLRGTGITSLPEGLTVGGRLDLSGTGITMQERAKVRALHDGDYADGRYLYADGILTHIRNRKCVNGITYFSGKIPGRNVVYDGNHYAHCKTFRDGVADLLFKSAADRGAVQYRNLPLDKPFPVEDLKTMYRVITGACRQGTQAFIDSLGADLREQYTIREVIGLTKNQYGGQKFAEFFGTL